MWTGIRNGHAIVEKEQGKNKQVSRKTANSAKAKKTKIEEKDQQVKIQITIKRTSNRAQNQYFKKILKKIQTTERKNIKSKTEKVNQNEINRQTKTIFFG